MGRRLETAHISFGLVTIPVGIYSAIDEQDIHFNQLHAVCGSRIKQQRFCPVCQREVKYEELTKGYEITKDEYVRIDQEELDRLQAAESEAMQILEFVPLSAVDPIYFESTYYLGVEKQGEKAYQLLAQAMEDMQRVALAKYVWRGKDSLHVIRSVEGRLLLHRMYYHDEIRPFIEVPKSDQKPASAELKLATQLIDSISTDRFDAGAYQDEYRQRVIELIEQKSKGKTVTLAPKAAAPATDVVDLMQRLKESLAQSAQKKPLDRGLYPHKLLVNQPRKLRPGDDDGRLLRSRSLPYPPSRCVPVEGLSPRRSPPATRRRQIVHVLIPESRRASNGERSHRCGRVGGQDPKSSGMPGTATGRGYLHRQCKNLCLGQTGGRVGWCLALATGFWPISPQF